MKTNGALTGLRRNAVLIMSWLTLWGIAFPCALAEPPASGAPRISASEAVSVQHALQANPMVGQGALSAIQKNPALVQSLAAAFRKNPQAMENLNRTLSNSPQLRQQLNSAMQTDSRGGGDSVEASASRDLPPQTVGYGPQPAIPPGAGAAGHGQQPAPMAESNRPFAGTGWDKTQSEESAYRSAFRQVTAQAFPLKPDEIITLHRLLDATEAAVSTHPKPPPKPVSASVVVSTAPGSPPPIVRLSKGYVSSLVFLDSTGAPWPIKVYDLGDPSAFNIAWDRKGNTLMVQAMQEYAYGNIAINLRGMNTPITLTFVTGQPVVDYRVDLRVMGRGPLAKPDLDSLEMPDQADATLLGVLDGIAPQGSTPLKTQSHGVQVWAYKDLMYVRTQYNLLSPAWLAKMSSADGTHAYKLQKASALLVARHGTVSPVNIEGL